MPLFVFVFMLRPHRNRQAAAVAMPRWRTSSRSPPLPRWVRTKLRDSYIKCTLYNKHPGQFKRLLNPIFQRRKTDVYLMTDISQTESFFKPHNFLWSLFVANLVLEKSSLFEEVLSPWGRYTAQSAGRLSSEWNAAAHSLGMKFPLHFCRQLFFLFFFDEASVESIVFYLLSTMRVPLKAFAFVEILDPNLRPSLCSQNV